MYSESSNPSSLLAKYYRLDQTEAWQFLLRRLTRKDRFAFLPLFAPEDAGVEVARRELESWLKKRGEHLVVITLHPDGPSEILTDALIDSLQNPDWIHWIQAAPLDTISEKESQLATRWQDPVAFLNSRRNELQRTLKAPLIFAAPEELAPFLRDHSPDLWDIRGGSHFLDPPQSDPKLVSEASRLDDTLGIPGDPYFTLSLAKELEGTPERDLERADLISRAGRQAFHIRDLAFSEELLRQSLELSEVREGSVETLSHRKYDLAAVLYEQGRYGEAVVEAQAALKLAEERWGADSLESAVIYNFMGLISYKLGHFSDAERCYKRALMVGEKILGGENPEIVVFLSNLGALYRNEGKLKEAEPLLRRALEVTREFYGSDHLAMSSALNNSANLLLDQGKLTEGELLIRQALDISKNIYGAKHPDIAVRIGNLASNLQRQGSLDEAENLMRQALEISEATLGGFHPDVSLRMNNLAGVLLDKGNLEEAEDLFRKSLEISEKTLGEDHPYVAVRLNNLASVLKQQGQLSEAEALCRRALNISEARLGRNHVEVAIRLNNLAGLLKDQGKLLAAEPLLRRQLRIFFLYRKLNGTPHEYEKISLGNYLSILRQTGRGEKEAKKIVRRLRQEVEAERTRD